MSKYLLLSSITALSVLPTAFLLGIGGINNPGKSFPSIYLTESNSLYLLYTSKGPFLSLPIQIV